MLDKLFALTLHLKEKKQEKLDPKYGRHVFEYIRMLLRQR